MIDLRSLGGEYCERLLQAAWHSVFRFTDDDDVARHANDREWLAVGYMNQYLEVWFVRMVVVCSRL